MNFQSFASACGLAIHRLIADGRIHRCPTTAKPNSDNGAYMLDGDRGWAMDWQQGDQVQWWHDPNAKPWTVEQKAEAERKRREQAKEKARARHQAAADAARMMGEAELLMPRAEGPRRGLKAPMPAIEGHPYLVRKGFPLEPCFVHEGELLVPMFDLFGPGRPIGLQRIKPDGEKKFLFGQRSKGAVHRFGNGRAREVWLCEGYVTALSVRLAVKRLYRTADVVACFSAGNLTYVASKGVGTHVMADNDAAKTGEEAASATGLCWTMPATVGQDANDLMLAEGIDAVCELMRERI